MSLNAMKKTLILTSIVICIAVWWALWKSNDATLPNQIPKAVVSVAVASEKPLDAAAFDRLPLTNTNSEINFTSYKTIAGRTIAVQGGWNGSLGSRVSGQALVDRKEYRVHQLDLQIDVASLWSEHDQLTEALLSKGFFNVEDHPQAEFLSTSIEVAANAQQPSEPATHLITGNLSINGITRSIIFPVRFAWRNSHLQMESQFMLNRKEFDIEFKDSTAFGLLTDEDISEFVALQIHVDTVKDSQATGAIDAPAEAAIPNVDLSTLPSSYVEVIPATQIEFELVLVPGSTTLEVGPLYVGKHEVTWDEFMPWVDGRDLENSDSIGQLRAMKLRPSPPYGSVDRGFGMDRRPALSMSLLAAEQYCRWLSEQTGKNYRLPTREEWEHIYASGGGSLDSPPDAETAMQSAVFFDNAWNDAVEDWTTKPVGSLAPNKLGIYDMAGNVCEWVHVEDTSRVALGGHFEADREELGTGVHVEDASWNRDYPNEPKSLWWFVNARWVGFRVVRDIDAGSR